MAKTTPRRATPTAAASTVEEQKAKKVDAPKASVLDYVRSLSPAEISELRALLNPSSDAPAVVARTPGSFPKKVRVVDGMTGYYEHIRRRSGDVFICRYAREFSKRWMEPVDASTPEQITTGKEELRKKHDEIIASRRPASGTPLVHDEPMADQNPLHA